MLPARFHDELPTIIFGKYCRSSKRAQQEIQEQSWNTEKQASSNAKLNMSIARVHVYTIIKHLSHFDHLLTAELRDSANLIKVLNICTKPHKLSRVLVRFNLSG